MESVRKKTIPQGKKTKHEKATDSSAKSLSHVNVHPYGPLFAPPMIPIDTDDDISYKAIDGVSGDLLEQNAQMFNQVSKNFSVFEIHQNVNILCKARDNILVILNNLNDMPKVMKQMPPFLVKFNLTIKLWASNERQAFRAFMAVVRIQAIFRGIQVRKQAAVTLRCM